MLEMIVAAGHSDFFEKYALLPNREGTLMKRSELRNATPIVKDLYLLVKALDPNICTKMVDEEYADIIELTPYNRTHLREELNVCDYNKGLVGRVCKAVHGEWKQFFEGTDRKNVLKNALLNNPEAYKEAISYFRSLSAVPYDFSEDKKKLYFKARIEELVTKVLEEQGTTKKLSPEEVLQSTRSACMLFKECVENHRSYKLMYPRNNSLSNRSKKV